MSALAIGAMMRPRSVAIIGMSAKAGSAGRIVLELLINNKFQGPIHLVGRGGADIEGRKVLASIDELPEGVDLAVFTLPAAAVREAVEGCVRRKVTTAVIFASGFAEFGSDGVGKQERIAEIARAGGLALVGPNCLGFMNFADGFAAVFFSPQPTPRLAPGARGAVAIVAQSGGLGSHLQGGFDARGVPVSCWISTGNEAGLGLADFIRYFLDDPVVQVIALHAEDIRRPQEFIDIAGEALRCGKPIVMMHPGRGAKAKEAARSHTGALAGDHGVMRTLVESAGVVVVDTLDELVDVSEILARFPKPSKGDLGILTFSGAFCGIAHDFCEDIGVRVPPLSPDTLAYLTPMLPEFLPPKNPLDLGTQTIWQPELLETCVAALLRDPAIGGVAISIPPTSPRHAALYINGIVAASKASPKPLALAILGDGSPLSPEFLTIARNNNVVLSRSSDRTLRAMGKVIGYGNRNAALSERKVAPVAPVSIPALGSGPQPEWLGKQVLTALGVRTPAGELARSADAAVAIADRIGYPVAMKAQAAQLAHKTEADGVALGVADDEAVRKTWAALHASVERAQPGLRLDGVLVEAMSPRGLELVVGARRDPRWGPVLMVGLGGIWVEALGDVRLMAPYLTEAEIVDELGKLKTAKLLQGFRGAPPVDIKAVGGARAPDAHAAGHRRDRRQSPHGSRRWSRRDRARRSDRHCCKGRLEMSSDLVTYKLDGAVALVGLNRPKKRNAINNAVVMQLRDAVVRAGEEADAGVIFGHGVNFSAGLDLEELLQRMESPRPRKKPNHAWHEVFDIIARGPIPFVAALHGAVVGGGLELAAAAHIRVADSTAFFGLPEGQRGIFVGGGGTVRVQRIVGYSVMADMMLTGRMLSVDEAEKLTIVRYVVEAGQAVAKAKELAARIAQNTPLTNWQITNVLPRVNDLSHDDGLFMEYLNSSMQRPPESAQRLRDFIEKRAAPLQAPGKAGKKA